MEVDKYILNNVKLFTNKKYFKLFYTIFMNLFKDFGIYQKYNSLFEESNNLKSLKTNKNSYWFLLMEIILNKIELKNHSFLIIDQNSNINPFVFSYLVKLCKTKIQKLFKLSIKVKAPYHNIIRLYLDLCDKYMHPEQNESQSKRKSMKSIEISVENAKQSNISQTTRLYSSSKLKLYKNNNNNVKKKVSLNSNNRNEDISNDEEKDENNMQKKYGIGKLKLSYCNSISRLFIGETDEKSVREKYLIQLKNNKK
jgi:hypothetical protein